MKRSYQLASPFYLFAAYGVITVLWTIRTGAFNLGGHHQGSALSRLGQENLRSTAVPPNESNSSLSTKQAARGPWQLKEKLQPPFVVINFGNWTTLFNNTPGQVELRKQSKTIVFCIIIACKAPYPIKLVHEANEWGDVTGPIDVSFRNRVLYDDHYFNLTYNFRDPSTYVFYIRNKFKFGAVVDDVIFSCEALHDPCLGRTALVSFLGKNPNQMKITLNEGTDVCPPSNLSTSASTPAPFSGPTRPISGVEAPYAEPSQDCDAIFYYQATSLDDATPHYTFRCLFTEDGSPGEVKRFECSSQPKCRNILDKGREQKGCWRQYDGVNNPQSACANCQPDRAFTFNAFVAICTRGDGRTSADFEQTSIGSLGFYGVPQGDDKRPRLFFSTEDANENPQEMISLTGFTEYQSLGATVTAHCRLSAYYASATFQFALEIEGEKELLLLTPPFNEYGDSIENRTGWIPWLDAWEHDMSIRLGDPRIKRVYCFGGIQDTYDWLNASIPIAFSLDGQPVYEESGRLNTVLLIVAILIVLSVAAIGGFVFVRHWRHQKENFRQLTDYEIELFMEGDKKYLNSRSSQPPSSSNPDDPPPVYCLPYNRRVEVARSRILLDKSKILGFGEFGVVLEGWFLPPEGAEGASEVKVKVGVKKVQKRSVNVKNFWAFLNEIKVMAYLDPHPNIVSLVAACTKSIKRRKAMAALEYCEHGDLLRFLRQRRLNFQNLLLAPAINQPLPPYVITFVSDDDQVLTATSSIEFEPLSTLDLLKFAVGIANGMKYISEKQVVHGDLSLKNILVTADMEAKISDFGLSSLLLQNSNYVTTLSGHVPWRWTALEALISGGRLSIHADRWSFGIVLWEIFSLGQQPYPHQTDLDTFVDELRSGMRMGCPSYANNELFEIMLECWKENRHERPSFSKIHTCLLDLMIRLDIRFRQNNFQRNP